MGHYLSEMRLDNDLSEEEAKEIELEHAKREHLENKLCEVFECNKEDLYTIYKILKDSWK